MRLILTKRTDTCPTWFFVYGCLVVFCYNNIGMVFEKFILQFEMIFSLTSKLFSIGEKMPKQPLTLMVEKEYVFFVLISEDG